MSKAFRPAVQKLKIWVANCRFFPFSVFENIGAGESGKSTILKQMKLIHASGFSKSEKDEYRVIIFSNLLNSFKIILEAMEAYEMRFQNPENQVRVFSSLLFSIPCVCC